MINLIPLVLAVYSLSAVIIKRLHDRNRSGKAVIMAFVPVVCYGVSLSAQGTMQWLLGMMMPMFIGTMLLLEWGVFKGNPQANQYGERA
ncbi:Predicted membrane protein [Actinobacillus equuli]|nr:Predicted membrane protein [Actinobacillus equuli]